jgi:phosphoribosylcarboxyaminoimidazole (NCAIR) mutase
MESHSLGSLLGDIAIVAALILTAALFVAACLAPRNPKIRRALHRFRSRQTLSVPHHP